MSSSRPHASEHSATSEPDEEGIYQAELSNSSRYWGRIPSARSVLLLLIAFGAVVSVALYWLPAEQAKWQIAAAQAKWLEGDLAGAIQILDAASRDFPDSSTLYEQRVQFYLEAKEFEKALADTQRLAALSPKSTTALGLQSQVLHHLGKHDEAIATCEEMLRLAQQEWIGNAPTALNSLAYAQAIGNVQLAEALEHIEEALRLVGENPALLDTRGFIKYRLGDLKGARTDIERAVQSWEQILAYQKAQQLPAVASYQSKSERASYEQALAVMLYHRSLVYDGLDMQDEAKVDRQRVRNLGYEPNEQLF